METEYRLIKVRDVAFRQMPNHLYHNFNHAVDVNNVVTELAKAGEVLTISDLEELQTAAWLHDVILVPGEKDNEERSAQFAEKYLPKVGYTPWEVSRISDLILSTKYPTHPKNIPQEIICDADVANIGREDFFEKGYLVFMELGIPREKWTDMQRGFLKGHRFYTRSAEKIYGPGKEKNINLLERKLT